MLILWRVRLCFRGVRDVRVIGRWGDLRGALGSVLGVVEGGG